MQFSWRALVAFALTFVYAEASFPQVTRNIPSLLADHGEKSSTHSERKSGGAIAKNSGDPGGVASVDELKRVALVIGNGSYQRLQALKNPLNDAEDICKKLQALKFEVHCHFDIATRNKFRQIVRTFSSRISPKTTVFIYYAGHGVQINGENYLLPVLLDANTAADVEDEGLSLSFVLRILDDARGSPNIVVLDACRNNPFPSKIIGYSTRGLARVEPPNGTILVYATSPNSVALDGAGRNGLFTKHLLENLTIPGHKLDELFQLVAKGVEDEARKQYQFEQTPYRISSYSGAFCIAGCENPQIAQQIEQFKKQGEEAARRAQALSDENTRLRKQFEERDTYVRDLEGKINRLNRDTSNTGVQSDQIRLERSRLADELTAVRAQQRSAEKLRFEAAARDKEITDLRAQVSTFESKAQQLEEYRLQVQILQKKNAEKNNLLSNKARQEKVSKPIIVPSF
jgi:uncharacterized caspase-like protein